MTKRFYVTMEADCSECKGQGATIHPRWEQLYEELDPYDSLNSFDAVVDWFRQQGFEDPPDEEIPCYECDGSGTIRREVELREALAEIGVGGVYR